MERILAVSVVFRNMTVMNCIGIRIPKIGGVVKRSIHTSLPNYGYPPIRLHKPDVNRDGRLGLEEGQF